ncbi:MAG TPA: STAS domain-containing protein [Actinomycetota bacterium]|nr:STAS domain-containing protein [Actinomycetota bacterium]
MDYTGGEALRGLFYELGDRNVTLVLADVAPLVGERLARYGLLDELGGNAVYETVQDVVDERTITGGDRG